MGFSYFNGKFPIRRMMVNDIWQWRKGSAMLVLSIEHKHERWTITFFDTGKRTVVENIYNTSFVYVADDTVCIRDGAELDLAKYRQFPESSG